MSDRAYTLYVCDCDGRLWTADQVGMECWLCKTEVRAATASVTDDSERPVFDPAQGKLL